MKLGFLSLGCDKNVVDAEHMLSRLIQGGFSLTDDYAEADVLVVNTCAFIDSAKEESIDAILSLAEYKKTGRAKALVVAGCMAQRYADEIRSEIPEVDGIVGTSSYDEIVPVVSAALSGEYAVARSSADDTVDDSETGRLHSTGLFYGYLKIAEGCSKHCTYCIIPKLRGSYRSIPMVQLLKEARELAAQGVSELILVAQETTLYGTDLYGKKALPELLQKLSRIDGIRQIRILYAYPEEIDDALIDEIRTNPKVCHYIDMPVQHCSDPVLRRMGRRTDKARLEAVVQKLRGAIPDIAIRTTVICGFPGETRQQHEELLSFLRRMRFDRLGAFAYSREEGTPAAEFADQIDAETAAAWVEEVMLQQQEISLSIHRGLVGMTVPAVIEGSVPEDEIYVCRTWRDAPDVDGFLFVPRNGSDLPSGTEIRVRITDASAYDLTGEWAEEEDPEDE